MVLHSTIVTFTFYPSYQISDHHMTFSQFPKLPHFSSLALSDSPSTKISTSFNNPPLKAFRNYNPSFSFVSSSFACWSFLSNLVDKGDNFSTALCPSVVLTLSSTSLFHFKTFSFTMGLSCLIFFL